MCLFVNFSLLLVYINQNKILVLQITYDNCQFLGQPY